MRWREYPEYKTNEMVWLDEIPEHWDIRKLKYIASVKFSNVDKKFEVEEEPVSLCNYVDVYHNERITEDLDFMEATATPTEINEFTLQKGNIIVTKDSESWDDIAVPAFVPSNLPGVVIGYHLARIRPNTGLIDGRYLFWALCSLGINYQFKVESTGVTRYGLGKYWLDNGLFPVPSLVEQNSIADFLERETSQIDSLVSEKLRQIDLLREKRMAFIAGAVTRGLNSDADMRDSNLEWTEEVPVHWHEHRMSYLGRSISGGTPSREEARYWDGNILWISPKDMKTRVLTDSIEHISEEAVEKAGLVMIRPPMVLFVVRGMILAHSFPVALVNTPSTINQDMKALKLEKNIDPNYFTYFLEGLKEYVLSLVDDASHGTKKIRTELWRTVRLFLPPYQEQLRIAAILDQETDRYEKLIEKIRVSIDFLREYRDALVTAAVTGQIDVRQEVEAAS